MRKDNSKRKLEIKHRTSILKQISGKHASNKIYDEKNLKRLISHLRQRRRKKYDDMHKECCLREETSEVRTDAQVKLRCRQLPNVVQELRKAILRQDWDEAVTLLMVLCHPGLKLYSPIILRTCCILLFNHKSSNIELLQGFIRLITGYILEEDVNKFIRILFALRKSAVTNSGSGKYVRKGDYKVTRDCEFESL